MIKGVNKQVLEICETQNGYFEKALFFVRPEYSGFSEGRLRENASRELDGLKLTPSRYPKNRRAGLRRFALFAAVFTAGALLGGISVSLF